mgnify:CR=1 FL=1
MDLESSLEEGAADRDELAGPIYLDELAKQNDLPHEMEWEEGLPLSAPVNSQSAKSYVQSLISDKTKAEKAVAKQLLNEIGLREKIRRDSIRSIDEDICQSENLLNEIRAITEAPYFPAIDDLRFGSRRTTLEMKLLELNELKRRQEVEAWKDESTLRRYLLFAFRDYWIAARRSQLLRFGGNLETNNEDVAAGD